MEQLTPEQRKEFDTYRKEQQAAEQKAKAPPRPAGTRIPPPVQRGGGGAARTARRGGEGGFDAVDPEPAPRDVLQTMILRVRPRRPYRGEDMDVPMRYRPGGPPDRYRPRRPVPRAISCSRSSRASWPGI